MSRTVICCRHIYFVIHLVIGPNSETNKNIVVRVPIQRKTKAIQ